MNERSVACVSIIILAMAFVSFRWPLKEGSMSSTFGESRWDHFHTGIDVVGADGNVSPLDRGALLYYWDKSIFPLENYPGGGNYKVLAHKNGIYSVYMHLENGISANKSYNPEDSIARMGNTGHSFNRHLHFSVLDTAKRTAINPLGILPRRQDVKPPVISDIAFHIGEKYVIVRDKSNIRLTRHYPLLIKINDSMVGNENLGIGRLAVVFNGKKALEKEFNSISYAGGKLSIGGKGFEDLFDKKGYYRVGGLTYAEGENIVKVTASDFAGNTSEKEYTFTVKLDMNKE